MRITKATEGDSATAVVYLRVASSYQADQAKSLRDQRHRCEDYARRHDLHIVRIFADIGVSGMSARRPALDTMLRDLAKGCAGNVLTADATRLARDARLKLALELEIARYDVAVHKADDHEIASH